MTVPAVPISSLGAAIQQRPTSTALGAVAVPSKRGAARSAKSTAAAGAQALCVSGTQYTTTQDDEFSQDTSLNYTSNAITSSSTGGAMWSTQALGFANGGTRNNVGTDDAYYTDPSRGFGGYNPFTLSNGALNITTQPVPAAYAGSAQLDGAHWLSGVLEGQAQMYGYVEVSAKEPNLQGYWPAPLWLLGLAGDDGKGNGYEELDVNEIFGNALPTSTVQQTQIFNLSGTPPSNWVRTVVSPDPSTSYHTYGVLWTPQTVQYYVDRKATSPAFPNAANGPANPIIILQVFAPSSWAPAPASQTPETMSLQYFRWYQATGASCSPSTIGSTASPTPTPTATPTAVATATPTPVPTSTPTPVPTAKPTAGPTTTPTVAPTATPTVAPTATPTVAPTATPHAVAPVPSVAQSTGVIVHATSAGFIGYFGTAPKNGDRLLAFLNTTAPVTTPAGWTVVDAPSATGFSVYSGVVGSNGLSAATSYSFGVNAGEIELLDVRNASTTASVVAATDPVTWQAQFPRSVSIPAAGGLLLSAWGGYADGASGFSAIGEALPASQSDTVIADDLDDTVGSGGAFALRVARVTTEPYAAPQPFTAVGTIGVNSMWNFNGDLIWIAPK